jgi:hypothetical protein
MSEQTIPPDLIQIQHGLDQPEPTFGEYLLPLANRLLPGCLTASDLAWNWTPTKKADLINKLVLHTETLLSETGLQKERDNKEFWKSSHKYAQERIGWLEADLEELSQQLEKMKLEVEKARKRPLVVYKTNAADIPVPQADWMAAWRKSRGFEKQAAVIEIIGDQGIGLVPKLRDKMAERFNYARSNVGAITEAIENCIARKLIKKEPYKTGGKGHPPDSVQLTELGQAAYIMLRNQTPAPNELLALAEHKSHKHLTLNLRAREYLARAGYEVLEHESYHYLLDGTRQAAPDIIARKDDEIYYFEVERDTYKSERPEKWINLNDLSLGWLYVICETDRMRVAMAAEVLQAMFIASTPCRLYLVSLQQMKNDLDAGRVDFWRHCWQINLPDPDDVSDERD